MNENKVNINWFPGHMAKAKKELDSKIKLVDLIIELRDARIPLSSANPLFSDLIKNKPRLIILVKSLILIVLIETNNANHNTEASNVRFRQKKWRIMLLIITYALDKFVVMFKESLDQWSLCFTFNHIHLTPLYKQHLMYLLAC